MTLSGVLEVVAEGITDFCTEHPQQKPSLSDLYHVAQNEENPTSAWQALRLGVRPGGKQKFAMFLKQFLASKGI